MVTETDISTAVFIDRSVRVIIDKLKDEYPFEENKGYYHHKEDVIVQNEHKKKTWQSNIKSQAFETCRNSLPTKMVNDSTVQYIRDSINNYFN